MKKPIEFNLLEGQNSICATLKVDGIVTLTFRNDDPPTVCVRTPLPVVDQLIKNCQCLADDGFGPSDLNGQLECYVREMEREIYTQIIEIRKSIKRISRNLDCIRIAQQSMRTARSDL